MSSKTEQTDNAIRELVDWDPGVFSRLEPTALGEARRVLGEHGDYLLMAAEEDGSYSWFLLDDASGLWRAGNEKAQGRPATAEMGELIARRNRDYRDELFDAARAGEIAGLGGESPEDRIKGISPVLKALDRLATPRAARETMLAMAEVVVNARERKVDPFGVRTCKRTDLDASTRYLGAPNGVVDLQTGDLLLPRTAAAALVTTSIPDPFDPEATHPDVDRLTAHQHAVDSEWVLTSLAFSLHGVSAGAKALNFLVGRPDGGKSTLVQAVKAALGPYVSALGSGAVSPQRRGGNATPDMGTVMPPVRIAFSPETEDLWVDVARVKALTGSDSQSWRGLYQAPRTQRPTAAVWLVGNELPRNMDALAENEAAVSRLRIVSYESIPEDQRDPAMLSAFDPETEGSAARRQALVAALVVRAVEQAGVPPMMPARIAETTQRLVDASRGEAGEWIRTAIEPSSTTAEVLGTTQLWEAAQAAAGVGKADLVWGKSRQQIVELTRLIHELPPSRPTHSSALGKKIRGWRGWRLADAAQQDTLATERNDERFV